MDPTPSSASIFAPALSPRSSRTGRRFTALFRRGTRAFTLVEVLISSVVLSLLAVGVLAMIIQSRRLTEGSIIQNSVVTVMQGYIEQIKSMDYASLAISQPAATPVVTIPTMQDTTAKPLTLSWGSPPTTLPSVSSSAPLGAVDNAISITVKIPPAGTPSSPSDVLDLNVWIWVQDLTDNATNVRNCKAVTMIYTYKFRDGGRLKSIRSSLRTIRSVVPSF